MTEADWLAEIKKKLRYYESDTGNTEPETVKWKTFLELNYSKYCILSVDRRRVRTS